jgi:hypothetical protein
MAERVTIMKMIMYILFIGFVSCSTITVQQEAIHGVYFEGREKRAPADDVKSINSFLQSDTFKNRELLIKKQEYPCFVFTEWTGSKRKDAAFCDNWKPNFLLLITDHFFENGSFWHLNSDFMHHGVNGVSVVVENGKCDKYQLQNGKQTNIQLLDMSDPKCKPSPELIEWQNRIVKMLDHYGIQDDSDNGDPRIYPHETFIQIMKDFEAGKW